MHEALMWAGVKEVVIAHHDPNPTVRGNGCDVLESAGIPTRVGLMSDEAHEQMRGFMHWCEHRLPLVTVKLALDANGSVDDRSRDAQRFTSQGCLERSTNCDGTAMPCWWVLKPSIEMTPSSTYASSHPLDNPCELSSTQTSASTRHRNFCTMMVKPC